MKKFSILFFLLTFFCLGSTVFAWDEPTHNYNTLIAEYGEPTIKDSSYFADSKYILLDFNHSLNRYTIYYTVKPFKAVWNNPNGTSIYQLKGAGGYCESFYIDVLSANPTWNSQSSSTNFTSTFYVTNNSISDPNNYAERTVIYSSGSITITEDRNNASNVGTTINPVPPVIEEEETTPGGSGYPGIPESDYSLTYPFIYVDHNGNTAMALFSSDSTITFNAARDVKDIIIDFTTQSPAKLSMYVLEDDVWDSRGHNTFSEAGTYTATITMTNILSSPFVIYNGDGTIFFHLPLENLGATITGQMLAIMKVAVYCLALLISLVILSKVLRTYLT